jgi:hypothetical protein
MVNAILLDGSSWVLSFQPDNKTGFTIFTIILWLGKMNESQFLYLPATQIVLRCEQLL